MAVTVERYASRSKTPKTAERSYWIRGAADEDAALTALMGAAPGTIGTLVIVPDDCRVEEEAEEGGGYIYRGTAVYKHEDEVPPEPGEWTVSVDISGQSTRIYQARSHVADYAPAGVTAPNFKGAINVADGVVQGADVIVPFVNYTINTRFPTEDIDDAWVRTVSAIVGSQNASTYHGFAAGELLLTRISANQRGDGFTDVSFGFGFSANESSIVITGVNASNAAANITVTSKRGWDYLWVRYEDRTIGTYTIKQPVSAHVEQVYKDMSFSALGI